MKGGFFSLPGELVHVVVTDGDLRDSNRSVPAFSCHLGQWKEFEKQWNQSSPSNHRGKRPVMETVADGTQRHAPPPAPQTHQPILQKKGPSERKEGEEGEVWVLCKLCRQLTVSQHSHGECTERELCFDHLCGSTDSVCQCARVICGIGLGVRHKSVLLTPAQCGVEGGGRRYLHTIWDVRRATSWGAIKALCGRFRGGNEEKIRKRQLNRRRREAEISLIGWFCCCGFFMCACCILFAPPPSPSTTPTHTYHHQLRLRCCSRRSRRPGGCTCGAGSPSWNLPPAWCCPPPWQSHGGPGSGWPPPGTGPSPRPRCLTTSLAGQCRRRPPCLQEQHAINYCQLQRGKQNHWRLDKKQREKEGKNFKGGKSIV